MKNNLQETLNRIKVLMNLNENVKDENKPYDDIEVPEEEIKKIEAEVDESITKQNQKRELIMSLIKTQKELPDEKRDHDILEWYESLLENLPEQINREQAIKNRIWQYKYLVNYQKIQDEIRQDREERLKTAQITRQNLIDMFVTALEGGSNYWYYILDVPSKVRGMMGEDMAFSEACGEFVLGGGTLLIYDIEDIDAEHDEYSTNKPKPLGHVDMDSLLGAIKIVKEKYPDVYENIVMEDYDASDADVFFQIAVMGEVVFG